MSIAKIYTPASPAVFFLIAAIFFTSAAYAASPIAKVGGAVVNAGAKEVNARFGFTHDEHSAANDSRLQMRQHMDYGFNDWYALRLIIQQDKRASGSLEYKGITIENRFQLIEKRDHGWSGGLRLQYTQNDGDKTPHELDFRIISQVPLNEKWEWRHNTVIEHDVGENMRHGLQLEFRNQIISTVDPFLPDMKKVVVGLEMFNDFGRLRDTRGYDTQDHQLGPVMIANFNSGLFVETGYRFGISRAGLDNLYKLSIGAKF